MQRDCLPFIMILTIKNGLFNLIRFTLGDYKMRAEKNKQKEMNFIFLNTVLHTIISTFKPMVRLRRNSDRDK